ncbi:MAG: arginine--tRNA ligase [Holosporales bacterium]|nr:arginine--tRNA ligase [Holosporales bacterium]
MFQIIRDLIFKALKQFAGSQDICHLEESVLLDIPTDRSFGDLYTNAAMFFAKQLGVAPRVLAASISIALEECDIILSTSIAGPGFININVKNEFWHEFIDEILTKKGGYSETNIKHGETINVEFVSANPTGPLHTGHARNAVFGSVASNLLEKIGYTVTREFYINDQGNQIKALAKSLYLRYLEILGSDIPDDAFGDDMYCGEYIKDLAGCLFETYNDSFINKKESEYLDILKEFSVNKMMENIKEDLELLGITMDKYTSEADLFKRKIPDEVMEILSERGDTYEGVLPRPKGIDDDDEWEERPQTLFRSMKYGDSMDRAIRKSDGTWTYFAGDMAYHLDKIKRGYSKMVTVLGADHSGYVKRLKAAVHALSDGTADIEIRLYQLVNFLENGKPIRMSKRSGNFISLRDVVDKVGKDVTRYMMISRHHDVMIDFDFEKVIECSMDNPLFYIQYAYARICSVLRHYANSFGALNEEEVRNSDKGVLSDVAELNLLKTLSFWPERVRSAALAIEPHRIPGYLQEVAYYFHALWNVGKKNAELRFISPDNRTETISRLSLLMATKIVLEDGLKIMGITPMSEMK